eukprot:scaffold171044_cov30-Tisochrysis_lutea.AAC.4
MGARALQSSHEAVAGVNVSRTGRWTRAPAVTGGGACRPPCRPCAGPPRRHGPRHSAAPPHRTVCASSFTSQTSSPSESGRSPPAGVRRSAVIAGTTRLSAGAGRASTAAARCAPTCLLASASDDRGRSASSVLSSSSCNGGDNCAQKSAAVARHCTRRKR